MALLFVLIFLFQTVYGCPTGDICCSKEEINACMAPLVPYTEDPQLGTGGSRFDPFMVMSAMGSLDKTTQLCAEKKIQNAFACLNKVYNLCASTREGAARMDMLIDVGKWREAMDLICNNTDYIMANEDCEQTSRLEFLMCFSVRYQQLAAEVDSLRRDSRHTPEVQKTEVISHIGCSFTEDITRCLSESYRKHCPERFVTLLLEMVKRVMPPNCIQQVFSRVHPGYVLDDTQDDVNTNNDDVGKNGDKFERKDVVVESLDEKEDKDKETSKDKKPKEEFETESDMDQSDVNTNHESIGAAQSGDGDDNSASNTRWTTSLFVSLLLIGLFVQTLT